MTVIATASDPRFRVSRVDIDREGPTYAVDTLRDLHAGYPPPRSRPTCSSSPAPTHWRRSPPGTTPTRSGLAGFVGVTRPGHTLSFHGLPEAAVSWSRSRPSRSPRRTAALASRPASRSATSSPTVCGSTSPNEGSTGRLPHERHRHPRRRGPGDLRRPRRPPVEHPAAVGTPRCPRRSSIRLPSRARPLATPSTTSSPRSTRARRGLPPRPTGDERLGATPPKSRRRPRRPRRGTACRSA